jgi:hypothetical protein
LIFLGFSVHRKGAYIVFLVFIEDKGKPSVIHLAEFAYVKLRPLLLLAFFYLSALHELTVRFFGFQGFDKFLLGQPRISVEIHAPDDSDRLGCGCKIAMLAQERLKICFVDKPVSPVIDSREGFCAVKVFRGINPLFEFFSYAIESNFSA